MIEKRIAIEYGGTVGEFANILELFLLNIGIRPLFLIGEYNRYYENIVFDNARILEFQPDLLYIHTSSNNIREWPDPADTVEEADALFRKECGRLQSVWDAAAGFACQIIQNNFEPPTWSLFGNLDASDHRGRVRYV